MKSLFEERSATDGLRIEDEVKIPRRSRVMFSLLDKLGLTKEAKGANVDSITKSFDSISERMDAAIARAHGPTSNGLKRAESRIHWPGSAETDQAAAVVVEYSKLEDGTTLIGIDAGTNVGPSVNGEPMVEPDSLYGGRTVLERSPDGNLGVDLNGTGHVVPVQEIGTIDSALMAPLLDGIQQHIASRADSAPQPTEWTVR